MPIQNMVLAIMMLHVCLCGCAPSWDMRTQPVCYHYRKASQNKALGILHDLLTELQAAAERSGAISSAS